MLMAMAFIPKRPTMLADAKELRGHSRYGFRAIMSKPLGEISI